MKKKNRYGFICPFNKKKILAEVIFLFSTFSFPPPPILGQKGANNEKMSMDSYFQFIYKNNGSNEIFIFDSFLTPKSGESVPKSADEKTECTLLS